MNPQPHQIDLTYRFKYIAIGLIIYLVGKYAWKVYQNQESE